MSKHKEKKHKKNKEHDTIRNVKSVGQNSNKKKKEPLLNKEQIKDLKIGTFRVFRLLVVVGSSLLTQDLLSAILLSSFLVVPIGVGLEIEYKDFNGL